MQVTNLGITVKDSPQNTLIFVTRLDNAAPVEGATVSIINTKNETFWTGKTNADGIALAPNTRLRDPRKTWQFAFVVTAEKDGDVAYVGSDWQEGIRPWEFGNYTDLTQADPMLRGSVFTDRGVYKLGEEIHLKAILRHDTANGIKLLPEGTLVEVSVRDSQSRDVDKRTVKLNAWSSAEWTVRLPQEGSLGSYSLTAKVTREKPKPAQAAADGDDCRGARWWKRRRGRERGRRSERRVVVRVAQHGLRKFPRRRVSPSGVPRRRDALRCDRHRGHDAEGRRHRDGICSAPR